MTISVFTNIQRKRTKVCIVCHKEYQASVPNQLMCSAACRMLRKMMKGEKVG